jgi:hypothetical protein
MVISEKVTGAAHLREGSENELGYNEWRAPRCTGVLTTILKIETM